MGIEKSDLEGMMSMHERFIPLSVPNLKGNELKYVTEAIETEWVSSAGSYVTDFENKIAEYVKAPSAVSCQNGTAGLHIALKLCGVTFEDEVIVPKFWSKVIVLPSNVSFQSLGEKGVTTSFPHPQQHL